MKHNYLKHMFTALLLLYATVASAHDFEAGGIYYNILSDTDRTVEVTFKGSSYSEYSEEYTGCVVVPSVVTYGGTSYSITGIGENAFYGCNTLKGIIIGNNITSIKKKAFYYCYNLKDIKIPDNVTIIESDAFRECYALKSVVIGSSVKSIGSFAFYGCSNLRTIINMSSMAITQGTTGSGYVAFYAYRVITSIESIEDDYVFSVIDGINTLVAYIGNEIEITLPDSYRDDNYVIGDKAFYTNLSVESISIPNCVTSIGDYAFFNCQKLENIAIPNSVIYIGEMAFKQCCKLTNIKIPDSVGKITNSMFYDCTGLTNVTIPNSVTSIGQSAFYNCSSLKDITLGSNLMSIGGYAFGSCETLANVEIASGITKIEEYAFTGCEALTSFVIPTSITSLGRRIFEGCRNLKTIINLSSLQFVISSNDNNSHMPQYSDIIKIDAPNGSIDGDYVFGIIEGANTLCRYLGNNSDVILPNNYKGEKYIIGEKAFESNSSITSVIISNSVISIGKYAFIGCTGLISITIPNSVTSIENYAFSGCTGLTSVTSLIPADELFAINSYVFNSVDKTKCTLYVPYGAKNKYAATAGWNEFTNIVETAPTEFVITINQYGSATYCSEYALDFSEVEGLKAYAATGYKSNSGVVTLTRVQTAEGGVGLFFKGEPGEYVVPVIESTDEHSLNMLVGTLESTIVNGTDGEMTNYKYTVKSGTNTPMFYQFADNSTLSAGKAYLQIPTAWLPATAQKSVSIRFADGETTDIDELKGENGEVKTIYDLQGRVVENPTKGIYIVDGKKVFINK